MVAAAQGVPTWDERGDLFVGLFAPGDWTAEGQPEPIRDTWSDDPITPALLRGMVDVALGADDDDDADVLDSIGMHEAADDVREHLAGSI